MKQFFIQIIGLSLLLSCSESVERDPLLSDTVATVDPVVVQDTLPAPYETESATKHSKVLGWKDGQMPTAPKGFTVQKYADKLENPRWIYVLPNGDVLIAEAGTKGFIKNAASFVNGNAKSKLSTGSADRITLFRDTNKDGLPDVQEVFLKGLNQPLGMVLIGSTFYVANTDAVLAFPYQKNQTSIQAEGKQITELSASGYNNHWTRNLIANADGSRIYITVGSASNAAERGMEDELMRANILEIHPDGSNKKVYASGLRNPVGMGWAPGTKTLWTTVNERDDLGDELVPDYLTSVQEHGFYGWPWSYWGQHEDPTLAGQNPDMVKKTIVPEVSLGPHTASLGLAFYDQKAFPSHYHNGAFIGQHGSWNRSSFSGYKVVFVPFKNGKPSGKPQDFLTGFIANSEEVYGRPVGIAVLPDGSILVADDAANTIWRVSANKRSNN